jgi:hypothetical protein
MRRSDNLPSFVTEIVEVLSPTNPFGIKARQRRLHPGPRGRRQHHSRRARPARRARHHDADDTV